MKAYCVPSTPLVVACVNFQELHNWGSARAALSSSEKEKEESTITFVLSLSLIPALFKRGSEAP